MGDPGFAAGVRACRGWGSGVCGLGFFGRDHGVGVVGLMWVVGGFEDGGFFKGPVLWWEYGFLGNGAGKVVVVRIDTYDTLVDSLLRISNREER